MLHMKISRERGFALCDVLSALPVEIIIWRTQMRLMLVAGATAYLSAANLLLSLLL